jgi:putative phosphoribosyl transferase
MSEVTQKMVRAREVAIPSGESTVRGTLSMPAGAQAVIVFAHGSGSGRYSPRTQFVAGVLQEAGLGTLLLDLLEEQEADDRRNVFDISLLATRLQAAADWLARQDDTRGLALGYFGASTGAAAALLAAARRPAALGAVVSRGGRPDLASPVLPDVAAPTRLIVGGDDEVVLELNREAFNLLRCPRQLDILAGATHLFPEPGALEEVARLAQEWFVHYLTPRGESGAE